MPLEDFTNEEYLGDGVYASFHEAGEIKLRAPRAGGDHVIYLDGYVLANFEKYIADVWPRGEKK